MTPLVSLTEEASFEASTDAETIGLDRVALGRSQSVTEESEAAEEPIKPDRTR